MKELISEVQAAVLTEYERAAAKHGEKHNSSHEAYAVILEEYEEAMNESKAFESALNWYWSYIKQNLGKEDIDKRLEFMKATAEKASAEWAQVAAMCYKAMKGTAV